MSAKTPPADDEGGERASESPALPETRKAAQCDKAPTPR